MARTKRTVWLINLMLAVTLLGAAVAGIQHSYDFDLVHFDEPGWEFGYSTFSQTPDGFYHCIEFGRFSVVWWRRD